VLILCFSLGFSLPAKPPARRRRAASGQRPTLMAACSTGAIKHRDAGGTIPVLKVDALAEERYQRATAANPDIVM